MSPWIDTHAHLDAPEFDADRAAMRDRAREAGVAQCVIPAVLPANFRAVRELAEQFGDAYALGIHPMCTPQCTDEDLANVEAAVSQARADPRFVAVGEIGLDFFAPGLDGVKQERFYRRQLEIAKAHELPVILHVRRSADRLLKHLREVKVAGGIAHAFNGSRQQADEFLRLGFKLGFGGAVTFERALQLRRLAAELPLDAIVMETDAPDIPPHWLYRTAEQRANGDAQGRNEPAQLPRIAVVVAQLRGLDLDEFAQATTRNARQALPKLRGALGDE